jgi:hypothetical protein
MVSCSAYTCVQALFGVYFTGLEADDRAPSRQLEYPDSSSPRLLPGLVLHSPLTIPTFQHHAQVEEAPSTSPRDTISRKSDVTQYGEQRKGEPRAVWNEFNHEAQDNAHETPLTTLPSRRRKLSKAKKRSQSRGEESSTILSAEVHSVTTISITDNQQDTSTLPSFLFHPYQFPTSSHAASIDEPLSAQFPAPTQSRPSSHSLATTSEPDLAHQAKQPTRYQYNYRRRASSTGGDPVLPDVDLPHHSNLRKTPYPFRDEYDLVVPPAGRIRGNADVNGRAVVPKLSVPTRPRRPSEWDPTPRPEYIGATGNGTTIGDAVDEYALIDVHEVEVED